MRMELNVRFSGVLGVAALVMLLMPAVIHGQSEKPETAPPPIEQALVREGTLAVKLVSALGVGTAEDEVEAESRLGELGIAPRNGWIADYPVTPDIVDELQKSVGDAADAGKLSMSREEALTRLDEVKAEFGLAIRPYDGGATPGAEPSESGDYPAPAAINDYYEEEGPPVVTYYAPPPAYYYLYSWVPYPFWWFGFWFPGFFILNDFHRVIVINNSVVFISNHFNDVRVNRVFRIDPVRRFSGRTFAGIGAPRTRGFISTGVPRSDRTIFNGPRTRMAPGGREFGPSRRGGVSAPPARGMRMGTPPQRGGTRMGAPPARGGMRMGTPPVRGGGTQMRERR